MTASISNAMGVARTGLHLQETALAIKSFNIASQGVDAFKRMYLVATDLPYSDYGFVGTSTSPEATISPTGIQIGMGVQSAGTYRIFSMGDPVQTNNPLDLMIEGDGFFQVELPNGDTAYSRVGSWQMNANHELVMPKSGYKIFPNITLPPETISVAINAFGEIFAETLPGVEEKVGDVQVATFVNSNGLKAVGDSMFIPTNSSGEAEVGRPGEERRGSVKQGWREGSNVNAVEEITDLIKIEKVYEMLTKVVKTGDAMMESANRMGRT
jgi:flagellar basal-body rod protein FlgG